ncbi:MAG: T9SS type A sorting domain-containing protein [Bacteroidota bacterium]|nr:T9SS type A sorting domain-containing protein [Bacteroidota bacterium]
MKKNYKSFSILLLTILTQLNGFSQCANSATVGSSSNMFTLIRNSTNPIAVDKDLNTIIYAHRNNASAFGGSSGNIRYDVSTNAGATWSNNIGVVNPSMASPARYPNAAIYNPTGNTNPSNAYIGYLAATINSVSSAWNGQVTGVRQLNGSGNTENYNQASSTNVLIPQSMVKGAPGIFWAVDAIFNGTVTSGFQIYKGTWNGVNDITWASNFNTTPSFNLAFDGAARAGDYNIAFDPTGNIGWMSFLGHINGGPTNYAYYPIFYKTTDGGNSWTGPIQVDLNQFTCATSILTGTNVITTAFEHDLSVDINGNPHLLTTLCNGNNAYALYFTSTHRMFDITQYNGIWNAYDIANVNAGRGGWGPVTTNSVTMDMEPQISRTADGKKIFFSWTDNTTYTLGAANQAPNLKSRAFDVTTNRWTNVKDFTSCNVALNGLILFPHVATEVLEPTATSFKLASVYAEFTVANDPGQPTNFKFLDNATFLATDFSINQPTVAVSILQGATWLLCPSASTSLSVVGTYNQLLWSNGTITNSTSINTPGNYIVTVRNGCTLGADTIIVTGLTANLSPSVANICNGSSTTLSVSSNAFSYTWSPSAATSSSISVSPTTTSIYTLTATGNNCTYPQTISVNVNPIPSVTASVTNSVICFGNTTTLNGTGASTYTWTGGVTNATAFSPTATSSYTLTGTSAAGCTSTNSAVESVTVNALPNVVATPNASLICFGQSATLTATGANTYTWNTSATSSAITVSPTISTSYTVTGTNTNGCINSSSITILVSTCTGINNLSSISQNLFLQVYPNPNNGEFTISSDSEINLTIINNLGQVVKEISINSSNNYKAEVSNLTNGIYFIVGNNNSQSIKQKIIVAK